MQSFILTSFMIITRGTLKPGHSHKATPPTQRKARGHPAEGEGPADSRDETSRNAAFLVKTWTTVGKCKKKTVKERMRVPSNTS